MNAVERLRRDHEVLRSKMAALEAAPAAAAASSGIEDTMTLNHIVLMFPETRPVFEELFINVRMEGCACLDEVAWRHGMEARELIEKLEAGIARRRTGAMEMLQQDHEQLREQLRLLEDALLLGPKGAAIVRCQCARLLHLLHNHHRREDRVAESCRPALTDEDLGLLDSAHHGGRADLLNIYQGLRGPGSNWPWMQDVLSDWIAQMHRQIEREEQKVFPDLQRALRQRVPREEQLAGDASFQYDELSLSP